MGYLMRAELIRSYARTEVRAIGGNVRAGGLVGNWERRYAGLASISECYAIGNVSAIGSGSTVSVGVLIGYILKFKFCFFYYSFTFFRREFH